MKRAATPLTAAAMMALWPLGGTFAQSLEIVGATAALGGEATSPGPTGGQSGGFRSAMDRIFGPGQWRQTSGYRTQAQEDELRREGAGVVPEGHLSHHSMGNPQRPGAYDVVIAGMSNAAAAARLRSAGEGFSRVIAEATHGGQGPHLHIEPGLARLADATAPNAAATPSRANPDEGIYLRVVGGRRNPVLVHAVLAAWPTHRVAP